MFDARSLLESLVRGGGQARGAEPSAAAGLPAGLGDILGQLGQAMGQQGRAPASNQGGDMPGGLGDILGQLGQAMGQSGAGQPTARGLAPVNRQADQHAQANAESGGLGDILKTIFPGAGDARQAGGGGLMDVLGQVLGQATQGVREGAGKIDDATGATGQLRDLLAKATGKNPDEILAQLKDLVQNNQMAAGAAAGGLGAVVLGTKTGRSLVGSAARLGALALIGGLAFKALQNYQQGKPLIDSGRTGAGGSPAGASALLEAPAGSGYEAAAVTHDSALLYIRAMIAAAAADGRIDAHEQEKIFGGLKQAGLDAGAEEFLANELNNPATVDDLVAAVGSEAEAVQMFTAARVAIDLHAAEEHDFLMSLANGLGLDATLVSHIDAEARSTA